MTRPLQVGIVYHGDRQARDAASLGEGRFAGVARALEAEGAVAVPAVYNDDFAVEFFEQALGLDGLLVWVNPIESGRSRAKLDETLRELAGRGVMVSAHPDTILRMGTKQVLYDTRDMAWGSEVEVYSSLEDLRRRLPSRLEGGKARVLKRYRGHSGGGVWKVQVDPHGRLLARHAQRGCYEQETTWEELLASFAPYFEEEGRMIEQPYQERLTDGMVRCYQVVDRVEGFGHQEVNALYPAPPGAPPDEAPQPGQRLYSPPDDSRFQRLRVLMEDDWIPEMMRKLNLSREDLPLLWDADFLLGPKDAAGQDSYVLCEINVSSVSPFPQWAEAPLAKAALDRIGVWRRRCE